MRSALLLPSQNALDQLSRFPRPSQERINYLVQEFRLQLFDYLFPFRVRMNAAMRTNICAVTRRLK